MTVYEIIAAVGVIAAIVFSAAGWLRSRGEDSESTARQHVLLETIKGNVEEIRVDTKALRRDYTDLCVRVARLEDHEHTGRNV